MQRILSLCALKSTGFQITDATSLHCFWNDGFAVFWNRINESLHERYLLSKVHKIVKY